MDEKRIGELAERARSRNIFVYTDFLNLQAQTEIQKAHHGFVEFWGGADFAERKIARFGCDTGYSEEYPLRLLKIHPLGGKFATAITHRDVLGALMSLGIVREKVGDIFVGADCFAVVHQSVATFVCEELKSVGRNNVEVTFATEISPQFAPQTNDVTVSAQSNRLDAILSKIYNLSREKAAELVSLLKVTVDGVPCEKAARPLHQGETVSVRGYGKFRFEGECGTGKKGKTHFELQVFC